MTNKIMKKFGLNNLIATLPFFSIFLGIVSPVIIYSIYDKNFISFIVHNIDEGLLMIVGFVYYGIPFILVCFLTKKDIKNKILLKIIVNRWVFRFLPSFATYNFFLFDIARAAELRLHGSSTASVVLMFFPMIGIIMVYLGDFFSRKYY